MKISVIIPVYNVSRFIRRCVESLMRQTVDEVEYIFINDATPDNSIKQLHDVIQHYPDRKTQVKIVEHEHNKGLPAARNTGISIANGEYIFHCDSDDFIELDMLEKLYRKAKETEADIVWCDWFLSFEKNERYMKQPDYDTPMEALKGILSGAMKYNVWNKLVKRSLYVENQIYFPEGYGMGEDMTMIRLFACAQKVAYLPEAFYHYVKLNGEAFTNTFSERHLRDIKHNVDETTAFVCNKVDSWIQPYIDFFKLNVKYPFIISDKSEMYRLWRCWYPEANDSIGTNPNFSFRSKVLQYAAMYKQYWLLWLHYKLVYKFVYGFLYK